MAANLTRITLNSYLSSVGPWKLALIPSPGTTYGGSGGRFFNKATEETDLQTHDNDQ